MGIWRLATGRGRLPKQCFEPVTDVDLINWHHYRPLHVDVTKPRRGHIANAPDSFVFDQRLFGYDFRTNNRHNAACWIRRRDAETRFVGHRQPRPVALGLSHG